MRKKMLKTLVSFGLVSAMLLAACGSSADTSAEGTAPAESSQAAEEATEASTAETVQETASETGNKEMVTLKFFNDETWWPYTVWEGRIPEKISEKTDVTFEVATAADSTALNLMIASGDLGDLASGAAGTDRDVRASGQRDLRPDNCNGDRQSRGSGVVLQ